MAFKFASPILEDKADRTLDECPRGRVLRQAPWVYQLRSYHGIAYNASFDMLDLPRYTYQALSIIAGESNRWRDMELDQEAQKRDAAHAKRVLIGG